MSATFVGSQRYSTSITLPSFRRSGPFPGARPWRAKSRCLRSRSRALRPLSSAQGCASSSSREYPVSSHAAWLTATLAPFSCATIAASGRLSSASPSSVTWTRSSPLSGMRVPFGVVLGCRSRLSQSRVARQSYDIRVVMSRPRHNRRWLLVSTHGLALLQVVRNPTSSAREVGEAIGVTERQAQRLLADLVEAGYVDKRPAGRRNEYRLCEDARMRHP